MLGHLGLAVNRLIRVSFGPFQLGDLPEGAVEEVRTRHLREQLGERVAAAAGLDFAGPIEERRSGAGRCREPRAQPVAPARWPKAERVAATPPATPGVMRGRTGAQKRAPSGMTQQKARQAAAPPRP